MLAGISTGALAWGEVMPSRLVPGHFRLFRLLIKPKTAQEMKVACAYLLALAQVAPGSCEGAYTEPHVPPGEVR